MLNVEIKSFGVALPENYVEFKGGRRYRISEDEIPLDLLCKSAQNALDNGGITIDDIDVIIGASAVGLQPIPCMAALVHEVLMPKEHIPAFDVNSTCTSFITALDIVSNYIQNGRYKNALIVSGDVASLSLNENERHSFELFGDGMISAVITTSECGGILYSTQMTDSRGAHMTEVVGGLTAFPSYNYTGDNKHKYQFHMQGKPALQTAAGLVKELLDDIEKNSGLSMKDIDFIVPHQASSALGLIMRRLVIPTEKYIDIVKEYGNMVSASVPFALYYAIKAGRIKKGDIVALLGTAAGLTGNALIMRY